MAKRVASRLESALALRSSLGHRRDSERYGRLGLSASARLFLVRDNFHLNARGYWSGDPLGGEEEVSIFGSRRNLKIRRRGDVSWVEAE